jgi:hypothetical protein
MIIVEAKGSGPLIRSASPPQPGVNMRVVRAFAAIFFGAVAGFIVVALAGAVCCQIRAVLHPNADLRPESAWLFGLIWFGFGFGGLGALFGAVLGYLALQMLELKRASLTEI